MLSIENITTTSRCSIHILIYFKTYNFLIKRHFPTNTTSDGCCKIRDDIRISVSMPNKKNFCDFLPLKNFTGQNNKILERNHACGGMRTSLIVKDIPHRSLMCTRNKRNCTKIPIDGHKTKGCDQVAIKRC